MVAHPQTIFPVLMTKRRTRNTQLDAVLWISTTDSRYVNSKIISTGKAQLVGLRLDYRGAVIFNQ